MGIDNRARRAAKKRQRDAQQRRRAPQPAPGPDFGFDFGFDDGFDDGFGDPTYDSLRFGVRSGPSLPEQARLILGEALEQIKREPRDTGMLAKTLASPDSPVLPPLVAGQLDALLDQVVRALVGAGWSPLDLGELVRRRLSDRHLPLLAAALETQAGRFPAALVPATWRDQIRDLGPAHRLPSVSAAGMELALGLAAALMSLPVIPQLIDPPGTRPAPAPTTRERGSQDGRQGGRQGGRNDEKGDEKVLARVRSLLAKAESSEFPEEAEALSGKAQELVSRYALEHLLQRAEAHEGPAVVSSRRIWLDAPYVLPKSMLVGAVAAANRAKAVSSESLGFVSVVGEPADLDAVELLVTSLLVQANAAMLAHGRKLTRDGSRTAAFRRSFLIAYAGRIGERLTAVSQQAEAATGHGTELVPLLREQSQRVQELLDEMYPQTHARRVTIGDPEGYAEGRRAADRARLDASG